MIAQMSDFHVARGWTVEHARKQILFPSKISPCCRTYIVAQEQEKRKEKKEKKNNLIHSSESKIEEKIKVALPTAFNPARSCRIRPLATNILRKRKNTGF